MRRKLNVAMIGYDFMGRAHSNAWRQVGPIFDPALSPVMKVVCGRTEDIPLEELADLIHQVERSRDFVVGGVHFALVGRCSGHGEDRNSG